MSAKSEPDTIVLQNSYWSGSSSEENLKIISRQAGSKGIKIVMSENGEDFLVCPKCCPRNIEIPGIPISLNSVSNYQKQFYFYERLILHGFLRYLYRNSHKKVLATELNGHL